MAPTCAACGTPLGERTRFCHHCGTPRDEAGRAPAASTGTATTILPWIVPAIALLSLLAFVVGRNLRQAQRASASMPATAPALASTTGAVRATAISRMAPQERADRLFDRVMTYVGEGKNDSAAFFSPMAIQSIEALAPLDAHQRYDLGLLGLVSGNGTIARAQSDTILRAEPSHLLGLILGMRAAGMDLDTLARRRYAERFGAALVAERAKQLPEYRQHAPDIDAAARDATERDASPRAPSRP